MLLAGDVSGQISPNSVTRLSETASPLKEPFVYGVVDLFSDYGESWHLSLGSDNSRGNNVEGTPTVSISKQVYEGFEKNFNQKGKLGEYRRFVSAKSNTAKLETIEEEFEDKSKNVSSTSSNVSVSSDLGPDTRKKFRKVYGDFLFI